MSGFLAESGIVRARWIPELAADSSFLRRSAAVVRRLPHGVWQSPSCCVAIAWGCSSSSVWPPALMIPIFLK